MPHGFELVQDVNAAMADIRPGPRALSEPLVERGLVEALSEAAACPLPTTPPAGPGALPPEIEGAVYFCCLEALRAKHAEGPPAAIRVWQEEAVHFEVLDDGAGFPRPPATGPVSRTCETGLGRWAERWRSSRLRARDPRNGRGRVGPVELAPPIDSLLRQATDALPDCFAIYRAMTDERGNVVDFAVEHE